MKRYIALLKAVCGKLFSGFLVSRMLAELIQRPMDHPSDDPRNGADPPKVGVL